MVVAVLGQDSVGLQPVGVHDRAGRGRGLGESLSVGPEASGSTARRRRPEPGAADLDRDADERLLAALAAAFEAFLVAAEEELVDLDLALQQLALGRDHRPAQLLQHQPRGLIARQPELALELLGRDPRMVRGDQVGRPEPRPQRRARPVHHRPGRHRRLLPAVPCTPQMPAPASRRRRGADPHAGTHEPLRPARREQVLAARLLGREALLELQDAQRVRRPRHPTKLRITHRMERTGYASRQDQQRAGRGGGQLSSGAPEHEPTDRTVTSRAHNEQVDLVTESGQLLARDTGDGVALDRLP